MKGKKMNARYQIISAMFVAFLFDASTGELFKLSSLPQLKKWEIPSMPQKYALRTGRKFKNIDEVYNTGRKRSSHWSIEPELNFRELEFEDDAEKIQLDQNYKAFIDDDDDDDIPTDSKMKDVLDVAEFTKVPKKRVGLTEKRSGPSSTGHSNVSGKSKLARRTKSGSKNVKKVESRNKTGKEIRRKAAKSVKTNEVKDHSIYKGAPSELHQAKVDLLDSSAGQGTNRFSTADIRSITQAARPIALKSNAVPPTGDKEADVSKRSAENDVDGNLMNQKYNQKGFSEAMKRARVSVNNLQRRKQTVAKTFNHFSQLKPAVSRIGKPPRNPEVTQQKNLQESRTQAMKLLKNSASDRKGQVKNGMLGDQPSKNVISKVKNSNQEKEPVPSAAKSVKLATLPQSFPHGTQPTKEVQISQRAKIESPGGDLEKPKEKVKIVPANVARAVAMAMEQLKRDRMWGKVFVHVLPSGKLKVMVQETKKMPDE